MEKVLALIDLSNESTPLVPEIPLSWENPDAMAAVVASPVRSLDDSARKPALSEDDKARAILEAASAAAPVTEPPPLAPLPPPAAPSSASLS